MALAASGALVLGVLEGTQAVSSHGTGQPDSSQAENTTPGAASGAASSTPPDTANDAAAQPVSQLAADQAAARPQAASQAASAPAGQPAPAGAVTGGTGTGPKAPATFSRTYGDDQLQTGRVAWWTYRGVTDSGITARLTQNKARPTDIEVEPYSGSGPVTYTVTMVANTGGYAVSSWAWYTGMTPDQAVAKANSLTMRPISVSRYRTTDGWRVAMAMVDNSGAQKRGWYYLTGDLKAVQAKAAAGGTRITRIRGFVNGTTPTYDVLFTADTSTKWWWWVGGSPAQLNNVANSNGARMIDASRNADGSWNGVFAGTGRRPGWWYNLSLEELVKRAVRYGARVLTAQPLGTTDSAGKPLYMAAYTVNVPEADLKASALQADITDLVAGQGPGGGGVAELHDSTGTYTATAGVADTTTGAAPKADARYRTASVSKTFVATELLKQVDAGTVKLDEKVSTYLPGKVVGGDKITVRMLLQHTSGLYNYTADLPNFAADMHTAYTPDQLLAMANGHGPIAEPGAKYSYCNTNYLVLSLIIEKVTGLYYGDAIRRDIITPLHLTGTDVPRTSTIAEPVLHGYYNDPQAGRIDATGVDPTRWYGPGAVVTTTHDSNVFFEALLSGTLLSAAQTTALHTDLVPTGTGSKQAGTGIFRTTLSCGKEIWWHDGLVQGYRTMSAHSGDGSKSLTWSVSSLDLSPDYPTEDSVLNAAFCYL